MPAQVISFNKEGYDPFIDFIKAYAIICVLIGHTVPFIDYMGYGLWAGMQVPLFILVQCFHYYKKNDSKTDIKKILNRVIFPFLIFSFITFIVQIFIENESTNILLMKLLRNGGGYGPGSYYPFIYLQIALLLPVFRLLFRRVPKWALLLIFLLISEGYEILCSVYNPPAYLYRISSFRYVFLIYLGWLWVKEGVKIDWKMIVLSLLSALSIIYFEYVSVYFKLNNEPWFFSTGWAYHRWPCYYFVSNGLIFILFQIYRRVRKYNKVDLYIKTLARSSYEIFLVQMSFIFLFKTEYLQFINSSSIQCIIRFVIIWVVSIIGGIFVNKAFNHLFNIRKQNVLKKTT